MGSSRFPGSRFAHSPPVRQRGAVHGQLRTTFEAAPLSNESNFFPSLMAKSSDPTVTSTRPPCTFPFHLCHLSSNLNPRRSYARYCAVMSSGTGQFSRRPLWSPCSAMSTRRLSHKNCVASAWVLANLGSLPAKRGAQRIEGLSLASAFKPRPERFAWMARSGSTGFRRALDFNRLRRTVKDPHSDVANRVHRSLWLGLRPNVNR
jgi:hypothetical protein